jgi:hypothetical protein
MYLFKPELVSYIERFNRTYDLCYTFFEVTLKNFKSLINMDKNINVKMNVS